MIKKNNKSIIAANKARAKEKGCSFCKTKKSPTWSDYELFAEYLSPRGRIIAGIMSGVCVKHQRALATAIKQARHLALIPFTTQE